MEEYQHRKRLNKTEAVEKLVEEGLRGDSSTRATLLLAGLVAGLAYSITGFLGIRGGMVIAGGVYIAATLLWAGYPLLRRLRI